MDNNPFSPELPPALLSGYFYADLTKATKQARFWFQSTHYICFVSVLGGVGRLKFVLMAFEFVLLFAVCQFVNFNNSF